VTREGFLKDKCGPRANKFEHHCHRESAFLDKPPIRSPENNRWAELFLIRKLPTFSRFSRLNGTRWEGGMG